MRSSQITIKDIAKQLGISPSTVSRALKNHPDISVETKRAVNELASQLRYQPNAVALSLKHSRTNTIGVIIPEIVHYFFSQVISGIEDVAYDAGYTVVICQSNERYDREVNNARALFLHRVDGILVSVAKETENFDHLNELIDNNIPLVFFDRICNEIEADTVVIDDYESSIKATEHLIENGKTRIAHLSGPQNLLISQHRLQGYMDALKRHHIPIDKDLIVQADSFELADEAVEKLTKLPSPPDGLFTVNDMTAIGAMQAFQKRGYKVPDDIAIVGFSDGRFSNITNPALTSVDQHGYEMGRKAMEILLRRISDDLREFTPENHIISGDLIVRGSSKKME
ncbi:MAG: LacI family DNA-binding transcriptional regulator [Bacteroidota bacterium]|nr:LacI family DNA-binding transcriptional regulator [Bacteroidota bacterium]MDP4204517.1 LacI family DNA-binding transcriptional regulator [Bacteroidota bacterium]